MEDKINLLLNFGAQVDIQDSIGRTPFLCATLINHAQKIDSLFKTAEIFFLCNKKINR